MIGHAVSFEDGDDDGLFRRRQTADKDVDVVENAERIPRIDAGRRIHSAVLHVFHADANPLPRAGLGQTCLRPGAIEREQGQLHIGTVGRARLTRSPPQRLDDRPAAFVDWFEAAAFVNFLNTDRGFTPAYDLSWDGENWTMNLWSSADAWQLGGENRYRHKDSFYFLPAENEWYKAAYYRGGGTDAGYWDYPTQQDTAPGAVESGTLAGTAVYDEQAQPASVFANGGLSAYGQRGMGGNVAEWTESAWDGLNNSISEDRTVRGGDWFGSFDQLASAARDINAPLYESDFIGFRVASVPEPSTVALLLITGVAARLWNWRLQRRR